MQRLAKLLSFWVVMIVAALTGAESTGAQTPPDTPATGKVIAPNENLIADGIPPVPATLAEEVSRYAGAYGLPLAGWHPTKRELWLKGLSSAVTWLSRIESPGGAPQPFIYIPQGLAYDVYFQPQAKHLIYNIDTAGDEQFQMFLYNILNRKSTLITDGKSRNTEPVWSRAGAQIIYSSSPQGAPGVSLHMMNPLDLQSRRIVVPSKGSYLKAYDWSPNDKQIVFADFISNSASSLWMLDVTSGRRTLLTQKRDGKDVYYSDARFSHDGGGIYILTDRDSDVRRVAYMNLGTGEFKYLTNGGWDIETFKLAPDEQHIALVRNEEGFSRLYLLDTKTGKEKLVSGVPKGVISDVEWHSNSLDLAFNLRSPQSPLDVYVTNAQSEKVERWAQSTYGKIDPKKLAEPEPIRWKSFDEHAISGILYRPPTSFAAKRPVIIDIHGGPTEQYRPQFAYENNYFINELGVAIIHPNVRGSSGYGKEFSTLDDGLKREDSLKDIGALLDWIKAQPNLDADRVMVRGNSYGGYIALAAAARYGNQIRAALSDSGPSNLATFLESTEGWRRDVQRSEFGDERDPETRKFLEKVAPLNNAQLIKSPLMIVQGKNDPRVPVREAEQMIAAVRKNKTPVWYLLAKDEGHGFARQSNRDYRLYAEVLFVKKFLLG